MSVHRCPRSPGNNLSRHRQGGFTLLEILVSFVVLSLVGSLLLQLFQGGMRNIASSQQATHAALLARSKLSELQAAAELDPGEYQGDFDATYRWRLQLAEYAGEPEQPLPESPLRLLHATIEVRWSTDGVYRVQTLMLARQDTQ